MKKTLSPYLLFFCILVSISAVYSQNPEWINYTCGKDVRSLAEEGDYIWVGTYGGLVKIWPRNLQLLKNR